MVRPARIPRQGKGARVPVRSIAAQKGLRMRRAPPADAKTRRAIACRSRPGRAAVALRPGVPPVLPVLPCESPGRERVPLRGRDLP